MPLEKVEKIWMDGTLVDWDDAKVHVLTHTLHYGSGVFEGIRAYPTAQGAAVYWAFAEELGWRDTRNNKDLAGRDRFVTASWPGTCETAKIAFSRTPWFVSCSRRSRRIGSAFWPACWPSQKIASLRVSASG